MPRDPKTSPAGPHRASGAGYAHLPGGALGGHGGDHLRVQPRQVCEVAAHPLNTPAAQAQAVGGPPGAVGVPLVGGGAYLRGFAVAHCGLRLLVRYAVAGELEQPGGGLS